MTDIEPSQSIAAITDLTIHLIENPFLGGWQARPGYEVLFSRFSILANNDMTQLDHLDIETSCIPDVAGRGYIPANPNDYPMLALHVCRYGSFAYIAYGGLLLVERPLIVIDGNPTLSYTEIPDNLITSEQNSPIEHRLKSIE